MYRPFNCLFHRAVLLILQVVYRTPVEYLLFRHSLWHPTTPYSLNMFMQIFGRTISIRALIMGILLLLVIVALVVYFMSGAEPTPEGQVGTLPTGGNTSGEQGGASGGTNTGSSNPESSPESRLFLISSEPAVGGTLVPGEERVKYFKRSTGHLFKNSFDGKTEERVSNITIPAIMQALWSPKKDYAVLSYYTDGMLKNFYSHYESTSSVESGFLSQDLTSMTFSPAEARVAYNVPANGLYSIITASPTNTNQKNVFTSSIPDFEISWPEKNTLRLQ